VCWELCRREGEKEERKRRKAGGESLKYIQGKFWLGSEAPPRREDHHHQHHHQRNSRLTSLPGKLDPCDASQA
jgi:hypothetical protein